MAGIRIRGAAIAVLCLSSTSAFAAGVVHRFEGAVTNVLDASGTLPFAIGQAITGSFLFNPAVATGPFPSSASSVEFGGAITRLKIMIDLGSMSYIYAAPDVVTNLPPTIGQPLPTVFLTNDHVPGNGTVTDQVQVQHNNSFVGGQQRANIDPAAKIAGLAPTELGLLWFRTASPPAGPPTMLTGNALPGELASSFAQSGGNQLTFVFQRAAGPPGAVVAGRLTAVVAVPEPSSMAMLLPMLGIAVWRRAGSQR